MRPPRVAYFPDSFHEVNGVAHTSRNFAEYARRHTLPFLCVRAGSGAGGSSTAGSSTAGSSAALNQRGSVTTLELPRSFASITLEKDLSFDSLFWRHHDVIADALHRFRPDILHLTGPSELGLFAAYFARRLHLPLAASWHTNVHEYASRRLGSVMRMLSQGRAKLTSAVVERSSFAIAARLYSQADVLFAPNPPLCEQLARATHLPCNLMQRGVDTELFSPERREADTAAQFTLGYVGRLSVEKNVALLPGIQRELHRAGIKTKFLIVGHGAEEAVLRREFVHAEFAGVLRGVELARAYAGMDLLVFPSHTDTFGNVVLEALASGVPAVVTPSGGPRFIVQDGITGVVAQDGQFAGAIERALKEPIRLASMGAAARAYALTCTWDAVFDRVYAAYPRPR